jgi:S1-C subfamily serine protease
MASFGSISVVGGSWRRPRGGRIEGFIRADVAMLPGFSGGPLVDAQGAVLGLNSSTLGRGAGLTIPTKAIDSIIAALQTDGRVKRGYLGVAAHGVQLGAPLASSLGLEQESGLLIVAVEPQSPAERDGLILGDIIIALNGEPVTDVEELQDRLSAEWVGQPLPIRVIRGGAAQELRVTIGERD